MQISQKDRGILRNLAKRQAELAASPRNQQLLKDWTAFGTTSPNRPMITIELGTFEHQILPKLMQCESPEARSIEARLLRPIVNFTMFEDDTLVPASFNVSEHKSFLPFNLPVKRQETGDLGHHFIPYLHDLEEDMHLLQPSRFSVDAEGTAQEITHAEELLGDILPVKRISNCLYACPMQDIVHIMNMDDMYIAMIDDEDNFHAMLGRLTDDYIAWFKQLEESGLLHSAAHMQHLAQGSYCFTDELPDDKPNASLKDVWLYMDSQETSGISPKMYKELVFPHYRKMMELCGLISYGCCEATHGIWDDCLATLPNLRKVSISPWCDEDFMGERLRGTNITYLRKPPATILGMDEPLDEDAARATFKKTAAAAKGCKLEIAQRDVYQVNHDPDKVKRFVQIAREELGI